MATENVNQPGASAAADKPQQEVDQGYPAPQSAPAESGAGQPGEPDISQAGPDALQAGAATEGSAAASSQASGEPAPEQAASPESPAGQDFGALLDNYEKEISSTIQEGEVVRGTVVSISDANVLVDIGYKSEGVVSREELTDHQGKLTVKPGDEIDVLIKSLENQDGYAVLSRVDAVRMKAWDRIRHAHQTHQTVKGRVIDRIKGGLRVDVDGVTAFLPGSQVDVRPVRNLEAYKGQELEAQVIKLNRKRGNVVLSRKAVLEESSN